MDYYHLVYKVDIPVQNSLLSFFMFNPNIRFLFINPL